MPMPFDTDQAIDEVIANCSGDMRGAIQALLAVNEHLEVQLRYFRELATHRNPASLH
jgi:DNA polymerase III delta prime subunit